MMMLVRQPQSKEIWKQKELVHFYLLYCTLIKQSCPEFTLNSVVLFSLGPNLNSWKMSSWMPLLSAFVHPSPALRKMDEQGPPFS